MSSKNLTKHSLPGITRITGGLGLILLVTLLLAACQSAAPTTALPVPTREPEPTPTIAPEQMVQTSVSVEDQAVETGKVVIAEVISDGPGWLVIHAQADGKPGPILGYSPVKDGTNMEVVVEIDSDGVTETLYAMLHTDVGEIGTFEFPDGSDGPVKVDGQVVTPPFMAKLDMEEAGDGEMEAGEVILLGGNDDLGEFLTGADGMTLYTFVRDEPGLSNCYEQCAVNWPPLLLEDGQELVAGEGIEGELDTTERTDGGLQVTYDGMPLYYWIADEALGDATGHGVRDAWAVARPEVPPLHLGGSEDLGSFLTDSEGMTLYLFTNDEPDVSNCYDQCAENWPPMLLDEGQALTGGAGVVGELGTTERTDGTAQITYDGQPLYYWINDSEPGDTTGHQVNDVWFVVKPKSEIVFSIVPGESRVTYEVGETFLDGNRFAVAIGSTGGVEGEIAVDPDDIPATSIGTISVDISQFTSDNNRRDNALRDRFLESATFPVATFVPTQINGLPESYTEGESVSFQVTGDLTVRETTRPVTFDVTVSGTSQELSGEAGTTILMSDFGVGPISIAGILNTEDEVKLTFTFVARP